MAQNITKEKLVTPSFVFSFTSSFLLFFAFYLILPILPLYLQNQYDASESVVGLILASYVVTALIIRPFGGFMVDKFDRKKLLILCFVAFTIFFGGYIIATSILMFTVFRALHGFSFGLITISNSTVAIDVMPPSRRNDGIGYFGISSNLSMALGPMIALLIYDTFGDFQYIFILAFATSALGLILALFIKMPKRNTPIIAETVEDAKPERTMSLDRFFLTKATLGSIALALTSFNYGQICTYVPIYAKNEIGMNSGSGLFFVAIATGLVFSRLITSKMMYKGDLNKIIYIGMAILIMGMSMFVFVQNEVSFYLSAGIIGLAYGFTSPAFQAMFINLAHHNQRGTANSTFYIAFDIGAGAGILAGGAIAQQYSYSSSFFVGLVLIALSLIFFRLATAPYYSKHRLR